ncbi:MAG: hypothetical protein ABJB12_21285, partial [Pseudomonadota bacterium]
MKSVIRGVVAGAWCLLLCAGCGGSSSDSDASCTNSSACGGDITGKWTITSSCIGVTAMNMANPQCPGASVSGSDLKVSGSITYNDDLTYTSTSTISGSTSVTLPASCLSMG